jgi:uncharacterized protein with PIN domain
MSNSAEIRLACDAMLGGLARWLRAAGYDAFWQSGIDDHELIRLARETGRTLLSADTGLFEFAVIRDGVQPALFVPLRLSPIEQLGFVLRKLGLGLREPRCMACDGELIEMPREQAKDRVPPRTFSWLEQFWECRRCGRVFWRGTHWQRIEAALQAAMAIDQP